MPEANFHENLKQFYLKNNNKNKKIKKTISFRLTKQQHFEYIFILFAYIWYIYNVRDNSSYSTGIENYFYLNCKF